MLKWEHIYDPATGERWSNKQIFDNLQAIEFIPKGEDFANWEQDIDSTVDYEKPEGIDTDVMALLTPLKDKAEAAYLGISRQQRDIGKAQEKMGSNIYGFIDTNNNGIQDEGERAATADEATAGIAGDSSVVGGAWGEKLFTEEQAGIAKEQATTDFELAQETRDKQLRGAGAAGRAGVETLSGQLAAKRKGAMGGKAPLSPAAIRTALRKIAISGGKSLSGAETSAEKARTTFGQEEMAYDDALDIYNITMGTGEGSAAQAFSASKGAYESAYDIDPQRDAIADAMTNLFGSGYSGTDLFGESPESQEELRTFDPESYFMTGTDPLGKGLSGYTQFDPQAYLSPEYAGGFQPGGGGIYGTGYMGGAMPTVVAGGGELGNVLGGLYRESREDYMREDWLKPWINILDEGGFLPG